MKALRNCKLKVPEPMRIPTHEEVEEKSKIEDKESPKEKKLKLKGKARRTK